MITTLLKSVVVLFTISIACGQGARSVAARIVYFQDSPENPKELFYRSDKSGEFLKVAAGSSIGDEPVPLPVTEEGKIFLSRTGAENQVAATAVISSEVTKAILFLFRSSAPGAPPSYRVFAVDENLKNFPKGGCYLGNLTSQTVRLTLGEFKYEMLPGKTVAVKQPKTDSYKMAPLQIRIQNAAEWSDVKDTMMRFSDSERYIIFVYSEDGTPSAKIYKQTLQATSGTPAP
jgi:hypothetical protein